jgi:N-acetylglutamate synthase-like GNAT family acetyltransferase
MSAVSVRAATADDAEFVSRTLRDSWGATEVVADGRLYDASAQPAFIAEMDGEPAGLLTYQRNADALLVVSLDAVVKRRGIGAALLNHAFDDAKHPGLQRVWLTTSNELIDALAFYLSQGMRLTEVRLDAMAEARRLKPVLPTHAADGTPIRDEWVLERDLRGDRDA